MTITEIARRVKAEHQACYVRYRSGENGEPKQYDTRPMFSGKRLPYWTLIDLQFASAIMDVYHGISADLRPKLDTIPLAKVVDFCWRMVA